MELKLRKPVYRTQIDTGLRPIEARNDWRQFAKFELKFLGSFLLLMIFGVVATCIAVVLGGHASAKVVSVALFLAVVALIVKSVREGPEMVVRIDGTGKNSSVWVIFATAAIFVLLAVTTQLKVMIPFAAMWVLLSLLAWKNRALAPDGIREIERFLFPGETVVADCFGGDSRHKFSGQAWKLLVVTNQRLLVSHFANKREDERLVQQVDFRQIESYDVKWAMMGMRGTLTLNFRVPFSESDPTMSVRLMAVAPVNLAAVVDALRANGVDGPAVERPQGETAVANTYVAEGTPGGPVFLGSRQSAELRPSASRDGRAPKTAREWVSIAVLCILLALVAIFAAVWVIGGDAQAVRAMYDQYTKTSLPVDGKSNLTGGGASISYPAAGNLVELQTDEDWGEGPNDGARWELRSTWHEGFNVVSLANYVFVPALDDEASIDVWLAGKNADHENLAGKAVTYERIKVDGRTGYVWDHPGKNGYWHYAAWFPQPGGTIRLECISKQRHEQFRRICGTAVKSLRFK